MKNQKNTYAAPSLEIFKVSDGDVISTSTFSGPQDEMPRTEE